MAYVPDEAIKRFEEVTGNAFKLFVFYCSKADKETGESFYKSKDIAKEIKWKKNHIYEQRKALAAAHWIAINADHVKVLFGFPRPKTKSENRTTVTGEDHPEKVREDHPESEPVRSENRTKPSPKTGPKQVRKLDSVSPEMGPAKSENWTSQVRKLDFPIKEEPDQLTRPINQNTKPDSGSYDPERVNKNSLDQIFKEAFEGQYGARYQGKTGDYVQMNAMLKAQGDRLSLENWTLATENYFASEIGIHTLADLCARYPIFQKNPIDRFKQPLLKGKTADSSLSAAGAATAAKMDKIARDLGIR